MIFDTWCVDDFAIQINQSLSVREIERSFGVYLTPDKHVLSRERNLFIPVTNVSPHRLHYLFLGEINLRIQIGKAKLTTTSATGSHLNNAKGRPLIGKEDSFSGGWVLDLNLSRENLPANGFAKEL